MVQSMTMEEMRALHHRAVADADAKRQELRLVLASRYRELVGSSEDVVHMRDRALELQQVVQALPQLILKLSDGSLLAQPEDQGDAVVEDNHATLEKEHNSDRLRQELLDRLRVLLRVLDAPDVLGATLALRHLCTGIAARTTAHPLANACSWKTIHHNEEEKEEDDPRLQLQMRIICAQIQPFPGEIRARAHQMLALPHADPAALVSLYLLPPPPDNAPTTTPEGLLVTYFHHAKTQCLQALLDQLSAADDTAVLTDAKDLLSNIVLLLQQDIIVYPYQMFVLRKFSGGGAVHQHLPLFDADRVRYHCSRYVSGFRRWCFSNTSLSHTHTCAYFSL